MKELSNKILIIDDSVAYYKLLMAEMCSHGDKAFLDNILFAETAEKGLELYVEYRPMVCLVDVRMPGRSGIDASRMICDYDESANILLVTNYSNDPDVSKAISDKLVSGTLDKGVGIGVIAGFVSILLKTVGRLV
jgi:DNA-binding NarL/FixJ family response regulator